MGILSSESHRSGSALPLSARDGAILLAQLPTVALSHYMVSLRYLYRLATFNHAEQGPLLPESRRRYFESLTPPREGAKSLPLHSAKIEAKIREERGLPSQHPLTARDTERWLRARERQVRDRKRTALLDPVERELIAPEWALECFAACLELGPIRTRERVEAWARDFADGLDDFVSKKAEGEAAREVPTPKTVGVIKALFLTLFRSGTDRLKKRYAEDAPDWLRPWPGDWEGLSFKASEMATAKRRARVSEKHVSSVFAELDRICAEPFMARFGESDLEIAAIPSKFWESFEDKAAARAWLASKNIALVVRNRAVTLLALLLGERAPELAAARQADLTLDDFAHPAIAEQFGLSGSCGALFVRASAKAEATMSAHHCPLPNEVRRRTRALLFVYNVMRDTPLAPSDPLILSAVQVAGPARGVSAPAIRAVVGRTLGQSHDQGASRAGKGYNLARRYTDQAIHACFEEWRRDRDGVHPRLDALTVKEAALGHSKITADPHTYSGLSDDDGRFLLSLYGAEVVCQTIFGTLGRRIGPDRRRLEGALAAQRAFEQARIRVVGEVTELTERLTRRADTGPDSQEAGAMAAIGAFLVQIDQRQTLTERMVEQERLVTELLHDRDLWVELGEGETRLSKRDLRALAEDLLGNRTYSPVRDFLTYNELALLLGVDPGTIRGWLELEHPEEVSDLVPWTGRAPIHRPNARTTLIAVAALDERRLRNPDVWMALQRLIARWPRGRGWDPSTGAKTKCVRELAHAPITVGRPAANGLLASASEECVRIFQFGP